MNSTLEKKSSQRAVLFALLIPVLAVNIWCGIHTLKLVSQQADIKEDYALINSIRNGLLSVELWKSHIQNIVGDRITNLQFTPAQEAALKVEIEQVLKALIVEADTILQKRQKTFKGKVRKMAYNTFVDVDALTQETPQLAGAVLTELKKPVNLEKLKMLALSQLNNYAAQTHDTVAEGAPLNEVLARYNAKNTEEFNANVDQLLNPLKAKIHLYTAIMIGSLALFLLVWWIVRKNTDLHRPLFVLSAALAFILLISSLALPLIDIDARVRDVNLVVLGEHLQFKNQVLYYRSKSIMQMVKVLVVSGKADSIFVGVLLLVFSIVFPICKLGSTLMVVFSPERLKNNRWVQFFAYKSGKWSMADVLVVAIFMSYIGFNGILNDQLKGLNLKLESWQIIATNETSLQPGFILFVSFVLFGLILSEILQRMMIAGPKAQFEGSGLTFDQSGQMSDLTPSR